MKSFCSIAQGPCSCLLTRTCLARVIEYLGSWQSGVSHICSILATEAVLVQVVDVPWVNGVVVKAEPLACTWDWVPLLRAHLDRNSSHKLPVLRIWNQFTGTKPPALYPGTSLLLSSVPWQALPMLSEGDEVQPWLCQGMMLLRQEVLTLM